MPSTSSASSSRHSLQEQEQAEEALRASLSTLLATGPRPRFRQRHHRPRKIYTVDNRSQRSSPLMPASPTHVYYSTNSSPHLRPSNPESILGDLSPHYFHGSITPSSRDYDSASSDSEAGRQKKGYRRGILSTGQPTRDHYYEIESTTLNSSDPPFSGSTTPLSPPHFQKMSSPPDPVANRMLQGPSSLLATRYVSWSVKAQSILDHATKESALKSGDGHSSTSSSRSSSPHSSPSTSGASTPSRVRRKRCSIPEPHQGFFSRALDQRSLASHVSVSRVGMGGTLCPPMHVGLRTGMLIRGSSPLRPTCATPSQCSPGSSTRQYSFKNTSGTPGVLTSRSENIGRDDRDSLCGVDDKENKRWYGQEIGLNLWQTTLGAAALLGTGFGSGMVKKVHNNSVQLHPKELQKENREGGAYEDPSLNGDSGYGSLFDGEVPSLASRSSTAAPSSLESSLASLRQQFACTHSLATKARKRFEQTRNHPDRIHPADEHILPPDPEQLPLQVVVKLYIEQYHLSSIRRAMVECVMNKVKISREDIAEEQDAYSGYVTLTGRVSRISLVEHVIYSQTFICTNPKCNNRNCLHFTPSATRNRVIKRTEDEGFMETGSSATLLPIDLICSHCNMEMPESVIDRVYSGEY
ncbi:hypothetical protein BGZ70_005374 [Mortierella alpina]|uniref:Uncharacterized protein n=1 Tax=Mortierella alpina TaxID=64518 RepID=A0A9P6JB87_MORAP|nr:hypothetical protein BGZ70_005374 [Mortierella alpina]